MAIQTSDQVQQFARLALLKGYIDERQLAQSYQIYLVLKLQALQCAYYDDQSRGRLSIKDRNQAEWNGLDIVKSSYRGKWVAYTSEKLALFDASGNFTGVGERDKPQIFPAPWGGLVWANGQPYHTNTLLSPMLPIDEIDKGPFDLFVPPNPAEGLLICDRGRGTILIADYTLSHLKAELKIREVGSKKAINLAYSARYKCCFVTDHATPDILRITTADRRKDRIPTQHGILGNIAIHDQLNLLFAVLADPDKEPAVLIFSLPDLKHQGTILLPGKRFSELDDPCDLISLSPDGKRLMVMSYTDRPALMTPVLSVIDTTTHQLLHSYELKKEEKPLGIAFAQQPPPSPRVPDFDTLLLEKGILKPEQIQDLLEHMQLLKAEQGKRPLDRDVASAATRLEEKFGHEEVSAIVKASHQVMQDLVSDSTFQWEGRSTMTQEEKQLFVERMGEMRADKEVSHTNGVFVLSWLKGLLS